MELRPCVGIKISDIIKMRSCMGIRMGGGGITELRPCVGIKISDIIEMKPYKEQWHNRTKALYGYKNQWYNRNEALCGYKDQ